MIKTCSETLGLFVTELLKTQIFCNMDGILNTDRVPCINTQTTIPWIVPFLRKYYTVYLINGRLCLGFCAIVAFTQKASQQPTIAALHT